MSVTAQRVAEEAGFSQPTVSQVLTGKGDRYSPATRQKIQQVASRLGYRPSGAARAIRTRTTGTIGLLLGTHAGRSTLPPALLCGIQEGLRRHDLHLMVVSLDDRQLADPQGLPRILREVTCDGLLIDYTHGIPDALSEVIDRYELPAVWINSKRPTNCVRPDDRAGGRLATQHLLALGHRRIAYADFTHGGEDGSGGGGESGGEGGGGDEHLHYSVADRREGYAAAMIDAGLSPRVIQPGAGDDIPREQRVSFARGLLSGGDRPTAVVAYGDTTVVPLALAAAYEGLRVGEDVSLMVFADEPVQELGLTCGTVVIPQAEVGRRAVRMLLERTREFCDHPTVAAAFTIEPGDTVAAFQA